MLHHPDRNVGDPDAAERFRQIHEAYAARAGKRTEPDNAGASVQALRTGLFGAVSSAMVEKGVDLHSCGVAAAMHNALTIAARQLRSEIAKLENARTAREAMRGRFTGKTESAESLEAIAELHRRDVQKRLIEPTPKLQLFEQALQALRQCSFRGDPQKAAAAARMNPLWTLPDWLSTCR